MPPLESRARFALLENRDAVLSLGIAPWLVAAAWIVLAAVQEPMLLRQHGVHLSREAVFIGWVAILLQVLWSKERYLTSSPMASRLLSNMVLLFAAAGGLMLTLWLVDCLSQSASPDWIGIQQFTWVFLLAWSPTASVLSSGSPSGCRSLVRIAFFSFSIVLTIQLIQGGISSSSVAAAGLAEAGAILMAAPHRLEN